MSAHTTDFMVSAGVGADFPITRNLAIRIMGKDHYGKADFGTVGPISVMTSTLLHSRAGCVSPSNWYGWMTD